MRSGSSRSNSSAPCGGNSTTTTSGSGPCPILVPMPTDIIPFAVVHTEIEGLKILQMKQITDERGTVREFYRESSFLAAGLIVLALAVLAALAPAVRAARIDPAIALISVTDFSEISLSAPRPTSGRISSTPLKRRVPATRPLGRL